MALKYRPRVCTPMIHCPKCNAILEEVQPVVYVAIYTGSRMKCLACGYHFIVRFEPLDTRSPTTRAPVNQDTTEALVIDCVGWLIDNTSFKVRDSEKYERFLRERLGRG